MSSRPHIEKHPPERGRRRVVVTDTLYGCCCCCCCCCLHTLGSLIGAAVSSRVPDPVDQLGPVTTEADYLAVQEQRSKQLSEIRGVAIYWVLVLIACLITAVWFVAVDLLAMQQRGGSIRLGEDFMIFLVIVAVFFPLGQLGASVLALISVALIPAEFIPDKPAASYRIARITGAMLVGTGIGFGIMMLTCSLGGLIR